MTTIRLVILFFITLTLFNSEGKAAQPQAYTQETKTKLDDLILFISQNQSLDIVTKIQALEADLSSGEACDHDIEKRFQVILLFQELDFYDRIVTHGDFEKNCAVTHPEFSALIDMLTDFARQLDSGNIAPEDLTLYFPEGFEENINVGFLHQLTLAFKEIHKSNYLNALSIVREIAINYNPDTVHPSLWLTMLWTESYLYSETMDFISAIEGYKSAALWGKENDLTIDIGTTYYNLGYLFQELNYFDLARTVYMEMEKFYTSIQDETNLFFVYYGLAALEQENENYQEAAKWLEKMEIVPDGVPVEFIISGEYIFALNDAFLGNIERAQNHMDYGEKLQRENPGRYQDGATSLKSRVEAEIAFAKGDKDEAFSLLKQYYKNIVDDLNAQSNQQFLFTQNRFNSQFEQQELERQRALETVQQQQYIIILSVLIFIILIIFGVALKRSEARAQRADRQKTLLLANASHEIRTPLNAIIGFGEILETQFKDNGADEKSLEHLHYIVSSSRHMRHLVEKVLDVSKLESKEAMQDLEEIKLHNQVEDFKILFKERIEQKSLKLKNRIPKNTVVYSNLTIVTQVLTNLIGNATKFTDDNGKITVNLKNMNSRSFTIEVKDDGIGMDEDELENALEIFGRNINTYERDHHGSGLGLPIVRSIVEAQGGKFSIKSKKGVGTSVTIRLPNIPPEKGS